jgi:hypothetical protein
VSMVLSARPSWPTSLFPPDGVTRCDRSPDDISRAERAILSSGRSPSLNTSHDPADSTTSRPAAAAASISTSRCNALVTSAVGMAMSVVPPSRPGTASTRNEPEPLVEPTVKISPEGPRVESFAGSLGRAELLDNWMWLSTVPSGLRSSA